LNFSTETSPVILTSTHLNSISNVIPLSTQHFFNSFNTASLTYNSDVFYANISSKSGTLGTCSNKKRIFYHTQQVSPSFNLDLHSSIQDHQPLLLIFLSSPYNRQLNVWFHPFNYFLTIILVTKYNRLRSFKLVLGRTI
jgi:hypothetical protein